MFASITSIEERSAGNIVSFEIDESNYFPEANRVISKNATLSGIVLVTDWGYPEGNRNIFMRDIILTRAVYDILIGMKEDNSYNFLFNYKTKTYKVVVRSIQGLQAPGKKMRVTMTLAVIEDYTDMETA